jgi:DNA polymerase-3 subunit delta
VKLYPERLGPQLAKALPAAVLVAGEETLIVEEACDAIRAAARAQDYTDREVLFAEQHFDWAELTQAGASLSLFASRRILEVRLRGAPGVEGAKALAKYCADPAPDTILLVISGSKPDGKAKWTQCFEDDGWYIPVWPVKPDQLPAWIEARMRSRKLQPGADAVRRLADLVEGNLLAAAQEIDKLLLLQGEGPLDAGAVERAVADSARFDVFQLIDATITGQAERAVRILAGLRAEGESPVPLVILLSREFRSLALMAAQVAEGASIHAVTQRVYPEFKRKPTEIALQRGSVVFWRRAVQRAARADQVAKGQGSPRNKSGLRIALDPWQELTGLVAGIASARGRRAEAA